MEVYEGGIRVPFIVKWKNNIKAGSSTDLLSVQYDFMATLNDLLQLNAPFNDGISYIPTLLSKSNTQKKREYTYFEYPENGGQIAIHLGEWKAVKMNMKKYKQAPWQLYNLDTDKAESNDVASSHADILITLDKIVAKEHHNCHIREWEFVDPKF